MFGFNKITPEKILKARLIRSQNMKHRLAIAVILFMSTVLGTQVVYAQTSSGSSRMYERLNTLDLGWELGGHLLVIFIAGAFGGFVSFLMNFKVSEEELSKPIKEKRIKLEQKSVKQYGSLKSDEQTKIEKELEQEKWNAILKCCLSQSIVGGAAAPPVLLLLKPDNAFALLAMSLVVGTAGSAFFRALQEQMLEYIRREEKVTNRTQIQFKQQSDKVGELLDALSGNPIKIERVKAIAEELKGACAVNTATSGSPLDYTSTKSTSPTEPVQVNDSGSKNKGNGNERQDVSNQNSQQ